MMYCAFSAMVMAHWLARAIITRFSICNRFRAIPLTGHCTFAATIMSPLPLLVSFLETFGIFLNYFFQGELSRSAPRPGDCALPYKSPVISVSASSPQSVINAAKLAVRFRAKFGRDVMTELVGWRKYGHNELDEPRITNPKLYKLVDAQKPTPDRFCEGLTSEQMKLVNAVVNEAKESWSASYEV